MVAALFRRELWLCTVASGTQPGKGQRPGWSQATWPVCGAERSRCTDAGPPPVLSGCAGGIKNEKRLKIKQRRKKN